MPTVWLAGWLALAPTADPEAAPRVPPPAPVALDLRWSAPEPCPDRDAVLSALQALAGHDLVLDEAAALHVDARVHASEEGFRLELHLQSSEGAEHRELSAATCDAIVDAASVVVLARLLPEAPKKADGEDDTPRPTPVDAVSTDDASDPVAPLTEVEPAREPSSPAVRSRVGLSAWGGVAAGLGARVAPTLGAGVAWIGPGARVEVYGLHAFASVSDGPDGLAVQARSTGGGVLGCWAPSFGRLDVPVCAGVQVAAVRAEGTGAVARSQPTTQPSVGLPVEVGVGWSVLPRLALRVQVGGVIGLYRPGFHIEDGGDTVEIVRTWPVGVQAAAGIEIRLP